MEERNIYQDIATRTDGNIYIGIVGPVRSGKSTFIKRFMDTLVLPNIHNEQMRQRATDELPQSSAGRTIMTTEPKFIPEEAIEINLNTAANLRVRLIDCVGYIVPSSLGYIENEQPRMVKTPWYEEEIPFNMAAEIGTKKVITEHSTIGLVVTTDGSISDIPREEYQEAEERVIAELKETNRPFVVLLNSLYPSSNSAVEMAAQLTEKYNVPVVPVNCIELDESIIKDVLAQILYQFPVKEISIDIPKWITTLDNDHWLKQNIYNTIQSSAEGIKHIRDLDRLVNDINLCENVELTNTKHINLGTGSANIEVEVAKNLFYTILTEATGIEILGEESLMDCMASLSRMKKEYAKVKDALDEVEATGYGIVMPSIEELTLEEPEIMKQGGRYGVRLKASAPSIHMMRADINTEVCPIVGSEKQSEDLVMYMLQEFEENPIKIWDSNIFGKSLHELVNEGLHSKLAKMPTDARMRMQETMERVINEGCSGLICIIL